MVEMTKQEAQQLLDNKDEQVSHFKAVQKIQKELGVRNFRALESCYNQGKTKRIEAKRSIKNGKKCTHDRFQELCDDYGELMTYRLNIREAKALLATGKFIKVREQDVRISKGECGLEWAKRKKFDRIKEQLFHVVPSVSGERHIRVALVDEPSEVNYSSRTEKGKQYSSGCTYQKTDLHVNIKIPEQWWSRVFKRGLAYVDDLFNLDVSTPLVGNFPEGVEVFAATWLVNSRGTERKVVRGYIARDENGTAYHGKTVRVAVTGLAKKSEIQSVLSSDDNIIIDKAKKLEGILFLADSYAVGNCKWGTKDFCFRHGIDLSCDRPKISIRELAKKVEKEPRREALAVLARGIRKFTRSVQDLR